MVEPLAELFQQWSVIGISPAFLADEIAVLFGDAILFLHPQAVGPNPGS